MNRVRSGRRPGSQIGQALIEGLVGLLALLGIWVAIAWVGRFQDMALQASHASRFAAFSLTRDPNARPIEQIRRDYFSGPAHQWADRRGGQLLDPDRLAVELAVERANVLGMQEQPGGPTTEGHALRREWELDDTGVARAQVRAAALAPGRRPAQGVSFSPRLGFFDSWYPSMPRHTAILTGLGHASADLDTQERLARSDTAWGSAANISYGLGTRIQSRASGIDAGWNRAQPQFDWLLPWAGTIPSHHLKSYRGQQ